jgi:hypothetical protein
MKTLPHQRSNGPDKYKPGDLIVGDYKLVKESNLDKEDVGFFILIDRATGFNILYSVNGKDEQQKTFEIFHQMFQNVFGVKIKAFRHDRGTEYLNSSFQDYLKKHGIEDQSTAGYSPESNGVAEARFRILNGMATTMMAHANLNKCFYSYAFRLAATLYNRLPNVHGKSPYEKLTGRNPDLNHFRVFGCKAIYCVPKEMRKQRGYPGREFPGRVARFIGFAEGTAAYLLWDGATGKTVISRDVKFFETQFSFSYQDFEADSDADYAWISIPDGEEHVSAESAEHQTNLPAQETSQTTTLTNEGSANNQFHPESTPEDESDVESYTSAQSQPNSSELESHLGPGWNIDVNNPRALRLATRLSRQENESINLTEVATDSFLAIKNIPKSYFKMKEMALEEQKKWTASMRREHLNLQKLQTYEVVKFADVPLDAQILDSTWVFTLKEGQFPPEKARLCVRGDQENTIESLTDIFATVVRTENFRMLMTLIAIHGWEYVITDVKNAFPNAVLQKPAYIKIPHGIKGDRKQECWKLSKALYGLRRSPAEWNKLLSEVLRSLGFKKAKSDWNFYYIIEGGKRSYCIFHVDDGIITSNDKSVLDRIIKKLQGRFELKINTNPDKFLGIKIKRNKESKIIGLVQEDYIIQCANKFRITDMRNFSTPLEPGFVDSVSSTDNALETNTPYRSLIGALLFIARMTRPDVLFAVSVLSKYLAKPQIKHWNAAKRVLAYLYQTRHECLLLGHMEDANDELTLRCYTDSTWGDDLDNRRSRSGGVMFFSNSLISAWSKQQSTVALSSTDAEYQAMSLATQEIMYYRQLLQEIGYPQDEATPLLGDNKGALALSVSTKNHPRVKHIDIRFHFTREQVELKAIDLNYVSTQDQVADIFTKALPKGPFEKLKALLHVQAWGGVRTH